MAATGMIACHEGNVLQAITRPFPKGWQLRVMLHRLGPGLHRLKVPLRKGCETVNLKQQNPHACLQNHNGRFIGYCLGNVAQMTTSQRDLSKCQFLIHYLQSSAYFLEMSNDPKCIDIFSGNPLLPSYPSIHKGMISKGWPPKMDSFLKMTIFCGSIGTAFGPTLIALWDHGWKTFRHLVHLISFGRVIGSQTHIVQQQIHAKNVEHMCVRMYVCVCVSVYVCMYEWMNEWTKEWRNEETNERMNDWTNERKNERRKQGMKEWRKEGMNE